MEIDWKRSIGNDDLGNGDFGDMATDSSGGGELKRWSASPQIHRLLSLPHEGHVFCGLFLYDHTTGNENQKRVGFGVEVFLVRKHQQQQLSLIHI